MSIALKNVHSVEEEMGSLLDAMLAAQKAEGYLTKSAMEALAAAYDVPMTQLYETASFYSMLRFAPVGRTVIQICRNAPCHVAGAEKTIAAFERELGISVGGTTPDGAYTLEYTECIGQCQASPSVVVNGEIHTGVTAAKVPQLLQHLKQ